MGTLLDLASLVVVPSGYKAGTVYSVVPTDGAGDLDFTRSLDTATRVGPDGLIEKVRTNLVFPSDTNTFSLTAVTRANVNEYTETTASTNHAIGSGFIAGFPINTIYTYSAFVKILGGTRNVRMSVSDGVSGSLNSSIFNIVTGTAVTATSKTGNWTIGGGGIENLGGGVYRIFVIGSTTTGTSHSISVGFFDGTTESYVGVVTNSIQIFNVQGEVSDFGATPYIPTTTAAVSVGMLANVPRLDYLGGGCPKLLLEPQRVNLFTFSEQINDASWTKFDATITANAAVSPDGFTNADRLLDSATTGGHGFFKLLPSAFAANAPVTISVFAKFDGRHIQLKNSYSTDASNFDLQSGTIVSNAGAGVGEIVNFGNGYYRLILRTTANASGNAGLTASMLNSSYALSYAGDITKGVLIYGCQLEAAAYPTSYIPTLGAAVTRSADAVSKTGISALIGQTQGTIFVEFDFTNISTTQVLFSIHDSANNKRLELFAASAVLNGFIGGNVNITIGSSSITNGRHKAAIAYKQSGDHAFYIDGVQIGTSATAYTIAALTALSFNYWGGSFPPTEKVAQALLFPTRLTNTQLQELTTL